MQTKATAEICNQCGRSVAPGSGWFVNRVPSDFGSVEEARDAYGVPYPEGAWQCSECANDVDIFMGTMKYTRIMVLDTLSDRLGRTPTTEETDACIGYVRYDDIERLASDFCTIIEERIGTWASEHKQVQGQ